MLIKSQSPHALVSISVLFCSIIVLLCTYLALQLPWLGLVIQYNSTSEKWQLTSVHRGSINERIMVDYLQQNTREFPLNVVGIQASGTTIPFSSALFIDEPDTLPTHEEFNDLMRSQQQLFTASKNGQLLLITEDQQYIPLQTVNRSIADLPVLFWFQLFVGVGGALTGALVWASRRSDMATILYGLTGVGYLIFAPTAAIYSTRELIICGELFRALSAINHFGALFFTASLTTLLWTYPIKLGSAKFPAMIYGTVFIIWLLNDVLQWLAPAVMHLAVLLVFSISFIFAAIQWRKTRIDPRGRAALRWFLLSIYTATGLFAGFIIIPAALHIEQPASQGLMFGAFLIMYWGLALGIVKYRLFQLEQWWHSITGWFISGLFIVLFDIVLVSGLALPQELALPIALAIAGWVYFPLRQLLWVRLGRQANHKLETWIGNILPMLVDRESSELFKSGNDRWIEILREVWRTPYVESCVGPLAEPLITNDGLRLLVPAYPGNQDHHFCVDLPDTGARLFTSADIKTVKHLQQITSLALERIDARKQGVELERDRIRRDMHDDLGATLLNLLHASPDDIKPLVRNAIADMRGLVSALSQASLGKAEAITHWRLEIEERCRLAGVQLNWSDSQETLPEFLSARTYTNLSRILREAISNALKYASPAEITIVFHRSTITVSNPVVDQDVGQGSGRHIMVERAAEIGARVEYQQEGTIYSLVITVPPE